MRADAIRLPPHTFVRSQTTRDLGLYEESIEWYKKRTTLEGFDEEIFISYLRIGTLAAVLKKFDEVGLGLVLSY